MSRLDNASAMIRACRRWHSGRGHAATAAWLSPSGSDAGASRPFTCSAQIAAALPRTIDALSEGFQANASKMAQLLAAMRCEIGRIEQGGGDKAIQRHRSRGKM
jgi:hypothetical protein